MDLTPLTGYAALREHAACIDLTGRGKIRATGDDRGRLLHAMTTNHIEQLKPGQGCYAFFLNAQGRILGDANVLCFEDHFLLDTEPESTRKLFEHLDRFIIADDVVIEDQTARIATVAVEGPEAEAVLSRAGAPIPAEPYSTAPWGTRIVARLNSTGSAGFFIFVPLEEKDALMTSLGMPLASVEAARVVRLEHGHPRYGEEMSERNLVQETDQLHGVHFNKGCYPGQEIVERVRSIAKIHRVLRKLEIDTTEAPVAGTKTDAAEIMSAAFSPALGKTVALAYVRMPFAEPGTVLNFGDVPAVVRA